MKAALKLDSNAWGPLGLGTIDENVKQFRKHDVVLASGKVRPQYQQFAPGSLWLRRDRENMTAADLVQKMAKLARHANLVIEQSKRFNDRHKIWVTFAEDGSTVVHRAQKNKISTKEHSPRYKASAKAIAAGTEFTRVNTRFSMLNSAWRACSDMLLRLCYMQKLAEHPVEELANLGFKARIIRLRHGTFEVWFIPGFGRSGGYSEAQSPDWPWSDVRTVDVTCSVENFA
jgi:hypothetical protein